MNGNNFETTRPSLKRGLKDRVVEEFGSDIIGGRMLPGELLPSECGLLTRFDISRTMLREAITVLSAKGPVEARQKHGTIVRLRLQWNRLDPSVIGWSGAQGENLSLDDVADRLDQLIEVRHIIEPAAAALAAQRGTQEHFDHIAAAYHAMEAAGPDVQASMRADLAFHIACLRASGNVFLLPIAHAIRTAMATSLQITNSNPASNRAVSLPLHCAVLDAILARKPKAAIAAMTRHLEDTRKRREAQGRCVGSKALTD